MTFLDESTEMKIKLEKCEGNGKECTMCHEKHYEYDTKTYNEMEDLKKNIKTHEIKIRQLQDIRGSISNSFFEMFPGEDEDEDEDEDDEDDEEKEVYKDVISMYPAVGPKNYEVAKS